MGLLGTPVLIFAITLSALGIGICFTLWNRLPGPKPIQVGGRLGLIAICQVTALLLAGVLVNRSFSFYESWGDLTGATPVTGSFTDVNPAGSSVQAQTAGQRAFKHDDSTGLERMVVVGRQSRIRTDIRVWLPPGYHDPENAGRHYPVVELFSGFPGSAMSWFRSLDVNTVLADLMRQNKSEPFILVAPRSNVVKGHDTECTDIPRGPKVATWLAKDVREVVAKNFRVQPGKQGWAAMGFSTGGFCASKIVEQYPDLFAAGVSLSGHVQPTIGEITRDPRLTRENSPVDLLSTRPPVALLLTGSQQDHDTVTAIDAMKQSVQQPTRLFTYVLSSGGHNIGVWRSMLPQAFVWLSQKLAKPR